MRGIQARHLPGAVGSGWQRPPVWRLSKPWGSPTSLSQLLSLSAADHGPGRGQVAKDMKDMSMPGTSWTQRVRRASGSIGTATAGTRHSLVSFRVLCETPSSGMLSPLVGTMWERL